MSFESFLFSTALGYSWIHPSKALRYAAEYACVQIFQGIPPCHTNYTLNSLSTISLMNLSNDTG